jgi:hypothetical protein
VRREIEEKVRDIEKGIFGRREGRNVILLDA